MYAYISLMPHALQFEKQATGLVKGLWCNTGRIGQAVFYHFGIRWILEHTLHKFWRTGQVDKTNDSTKHLIYSVHFEPEQSVKAQLEPRIAI